MGGGGTEEGGREGAEESEGPLEEGGEGLDVVFGGKVGGGVMFLEETREEMGRENGGCLGFGVR